MSFSQAVLCALTLFIGCASSNGSAGSGASGGSSGTTKDSGVHAVVELAVTPPSCLAGGPGLTDCGSAKESCCTSLTVTGGTFYRTYANSDGTVNQEADAATVSTFRLDKYAVTVGRFRQFVNAWNNGWRPVAGSGKHTHLNGGLGLVSVTGGYEPGWITSDSDLLVQPYARFVSPTNSNLTSCTGGGDIPGFFNYSTWTETAGTHENLPIDCVNWFEAYAFCIWDGTASASTAIRLQLSSDSLDSAGAFLPSDAESEYVAAGGSDQREYPWGHTDPGSMNEYAIYNCDFPTPGMACLGVSNIAPVGSAARGAGRWGQLDLAGNIWQWNLDGYFGYSACTDCVNLDPHDPANRVIRGGGFGSDGYQLVPTYRATAPSRSYGVGFRCARTP